MKELPLDENSTVKSADNSTANSVISKNIFTLYIGFCLLFLFRFTLLSQAHLTHHMRGDFITSLFVAPLIILSDLQEWS